MNGKKAKAIRAMINATQHDVNTRFYKEIQHTPKLVATGQLNPDGTPVFKQIIPVTRVLEPIGRGVYQTFKRDMVKARSVGLL